MECGLVFIVGLIVYYFSARYGGQVLRTGKLDVPEWHSEGEDD